MINIGIIAMIVLSLIGDLLAVAQNIFGFKNNCRWLKIIGYLLAVLAIPIIFFVLTDLVAR